MPDERTYTDSVAEAIDQLMVLAEGMIGYRQRLEQLGWSPTVSEQIAGAALAHLNHNAIAGTTHQPGRRARFENGPT